MKNYELLAPAGDLDKLKVALLYGADACFVGGKQFSLRAKASNFSDAELIEAVNFAHQLNKKIHVTVNIIPDTQEIEKAKEYLLFLDKIGVDAVIVSSPYLMNFIKENKLRLEIHVSTQCSTSNHYAVKFYEKLGASRVVLARECSIENIKEIIDHSNVEIETFIHGGLCSSISGRCHLSDFYTGRKANKGACAHSCRWTYEVDGKQDFLFGCKDLCTIPFFNRLLDLGINSFKIEGRMKSIHYIASVVRAYRYYIDAYMNNKLDDNVINYCYEELSRCESRNYGTSFFKGDVSKDDMVQVNEKEANSEFVGFIKIINGKTFLFPKTLVFINKKYEIIEPNVIGHSLIDIKKMILDNQEVEDTRHVKDKIEIILDKEVSNYAILRKLKDGR